MLLVEVVGGEEGSVIDDETSLIIDAISVPRRSKTATGSEDSRVSAATGSEDSKVSGMSAPVLPVLFEIAACCRQCSVDAYAYSLIIINVFKVFIMVIKIK